MEEKAKIKKYSGDIVDFDMEKLKNSLRNSKVDQVLIEEIAREVQKQITPGITTHQVYQLAFKILKRKTKVCASRYKLKKAIMELGPSGFPFEKYIGALLNYEGFQTEIGVFVEGYCIKHEVDVVAVKNQEKHFIECKYRNVQGNISDVKVPLYFNSRFLDIQKKCKNEQHQPIKYWYGEIYTNTRFSSEAMDYAKCVDLNLISWDYPKNNSLKFKIDTLGLFPITSLTTLSKKEKEKLLEKGIVLSTGLLEKPQLLEQIGIKKSRHKNILENIRGLCR